MTPARDAAPDDPSIARVAPVADDPTLPNARPVDFDDDPSIAIEALCEWYAVMLVGLSRSVIERHAPPARLVERAIARHRLDATRLFVEHWVKLAHDPGALTRAESNFAIDQLGRIVRIAIDAEGEGTLGMLDRERMLRFHALDDAISFLDVFGRGPARSSPLH